MNALGRWFLGVKQRPAVDLTLPCMVCQGERPKCRVLELTNYGRADKQLVEWVDGYRFSCQECGAVYSIDSRGMFRHSPRAMPLTPQIPPDAPVGTEAPSPLAEPMNTLPPRPKEKPRI